MTRRGLRSESQSEKEDIEFPPAQTSPTLSGEESPIEEQPSLKQIMDLYMYADKSTGEFKLIRPV